MLRIEQNPKIYSQNFLKSSEFAERLVKKSGISVTDFILEIGTGKGTLTKTLAKYSKKVITFEIDHSLYKNTQIRLAPFNNVKVIYGDFLSSVLPNEPFKIFSNIPFIHTSKIIRKIIDEKHSPTESFLIIQQEAANKLIGIPRPSQLSILIKPWFEVKIIEKISRYKFTPVPAVDSALVSIKKLKVPVISLDQERDFKDFVVYVTGSWKPTVGEAIGKIFTQNQLDCLNIDLELKPLDLSFDEWIRMFSCFTNYVSFERKRLVFGAYSRQRSREHSLKKIYRTRKTPFGR